jgi:seryl-tRNA synthetase
MLDINFIRENTDKVKDAIQKKGLSVDLDELLKIDDDRRALIREVDSLRAQQNEFNKKISSLTDIEREKALEGMKVLSSDLKTNQEKLRSVEEKWQALMLLIPNIPSEDTPVGVTDKENVEIESWGEKPKFDFKIKDHIKLAEDLDLVDFERGTKISGFRGYYLKNEAAIMQVALLFYALKKMTEQGFSPMITPTILREFALVGSGHFPFGKDDIYELANTGKDETGRQVGEKLYLAGTSEPSLLAYFADQTFEQKDLPKTVCGFSQCYRNEVGSYGKDTKGLYRIHEFMKVEQVVLCAADEKESEQWLQKMRGFAQDILKDLKIPYRVMQICSGDMGAGKRKMYDIESWMPGRGSYGETHSDSDLTDWQSRRLNIKYTTSEGQKKFVYALNNTVLASPRILIAILENNQNKDGSITVPEVLVPFCGFDKIKPKPGSRNLTK